MPGLRKGTNRQWSHGERIGQPPFKNPLMTYADYLAREQASDVKHEYLRSDVWAMAGAHRSTVDSR